MKAKYLLILPAFYSIHANAQLKLPADSTLNFSEQNSFFQQFLEQNEFITKTPIIYPDEFVSQMPILKPDAKINFRTPNLIKQKKKKSLVLDLFKEN